MSLFAEMSELLVEDQGMTPGDVLDSIDDVLLESDRYVDSGRWSEHWEAVFSRDGEDELVGLSYELPATEMQEDGDFYSSVYKVEAYTETVTKFRRL